MNAGASGTFGHGIHPPEMKDDTCHLPIRRFPFAPLLIVPLRQHIGNAAISTVRAGQEVVRGQTIAEPDGFLSVAMHAPASGVVKAIGLAPGIDGDMTECIFLEPDPASTQEVADGQPCDLDTATPEDIIAAIQRAGVVGLGGAGFPTHVKLQPPDGKTVDTLIVNGIECEPYLTTDHRVMIEQTADIFSGIRYLMKVTGASRGIIAVEANKLDAAGGLER
ncbi:MAG: electron transport complex subunit RsxC, partial [Gammaproteobacteria bacterium]|nr:electron transport complex subunit RsxC [Gammaproteobacteria bacterium]